MMTNASNQDLDLVYLEFPAESPFLPFAKTPQLVEDPFMLSAESLLPKEEEEADQVQNHVHSGVPEDFKRQCEEIFHQIQSKPNHHHSQSSRRFSMPLRVRGGKGGSRGGMEKRRGQINSRPGDRNVFFSFLLQNTPTSLEKSTPSEDLFYWKHFFPRQWERGLEIFFRRHFRGVAHDSIFNIVRTDHDDWSYFQLSGTQAHLAKAKEVLHLFINVSLPRDFITIYLAKLNSNSMVCWERFPYTWFRTTYQPKDSHYFTLRTVEVGQKKCLIDTHASFLPHMSLLKHPSFSHVFSKVSFQQLLHLFHMYHDYFKRSFPSSAKCKCIGSLGKWVYPMLFSSPLNVPGRPFPLEDIEKRNSWGNTKPRFQFGLWHTRTTVFSVLRDAGFLLTRQWQIMSMDLPIPQYDAMVKAKWKLNAKGKYEFKSCNFRAPVPIKATFNFTDLIYDIRLRLEYKLEKETLRQLTKQQFLRHIHHLDASKVVNIEKWLFSHITLPVQVKLSHWCPSNSSDFYTMRFQLMTSMDNASKLEHWELLICNFLEVICAVASAFPSKPP